MNPTLGTLLLALAALSSAPRADAQELKTRNVILVTIDGLRWQEVFGGADSALISEKGYARRQEENAARYWRASATERRKTLMPFFWSVLSEQGQLHGNRALGNRMNVTNNFWFSYPGYNELLVGYADDRIDKNEKRPNPNRTLLEFVDGQSGFRGRVAAFASWDVFPFILNAERSKLPINAGFAPVAWRALTPRETFLNELQLEVRSSDASRPDAFTYHYALEYLKTRRPRLLYLSFGNTDAYAHRGEYDEYLQSITRFDTQMRKLWEWVQGDPEYRDRTTIIFTTDHGRGSADGWRNHGRTLPGSEQIWLAAIGPDTPPAGEMKTPDQLFQNQVAQTVARLLGLRYTNEREVGPAIGTILGR